MKKVITAALLATLVSAGAMVYAAGTPVQNRQQGDLKIDGSSRCKDSFLRRRRNLCLE